LYHLCYCTLTHTSHKSLIRLHTVNGNVNNFNGYHDSVRYCFIKIYRIPKICSECVNFITMKPTGNVYWIFLFLIQGCNRIVLIWYLLKILSSLKIFLVHLQNKCTYQFTEQFCTVTSNKELMSPGLADPCISDIDHTVHIFNWYQRNRI